MSTFQARPKTALLVVDVQNGLVSDAHDRDNVIKNINVLVQRARDQGAPVVWVQDSSGDLERDSEAWQIVPELRRREEEPLVH